MSSPSDEKTTAETGSAPVESQPTEAVAATAAPKEGDAKPKAERNPMERLLVRGLIGVLLAFAAVEGAARYGYGRTLAGLSDAAEADDKGEEMTQAEFRSSVLAGLPSTQDEGRAIVCRWFSLVKHYEIRVEFSDEDPPILLGHSTPNAEEDPIFARREPDDDASDDGMGDDMTDDGGAGDGGDGSDDESVAGDGGRGPGGGPPGGGGRGRRRRGLVGVLANEDVMAKLDLDDDTRAALDAALESGAPMGGGPGGERPSLEERREREQALEAKVSEVLGPERYAIVRRHLLRELGVAALQREDVAAELGFSEDQQMKITEIAESASERRRELFAAGEDRDRAEVFAEMQQMQEESLAEALAVLDDQQRADWEAMVAVE